MTYFNRGNDRSQSSSYGRRDSGDRGSDRPTMHDAVCAKCGSACQVPFMPNGRKEVFCSKCFGEMNGDSRDSGSRESSYGNSRTPRMYDNRDGGSNFAQKQMFSATCDQCGERCEVPFRPTNGKPVLCSNCFAASKGESPRATSSHVSTFVPAVRPVKDNSAELEAINAKLDKILRILTPVTHKEAAKEQTAKILDEIETNIEKTPAVSKRKTKSVKKSA